MIETPLLDILPLWLLFLTTIVTILVTVEAGYRYGRFRSRNAGAEKESEVSSNVGATLGLLAFMLAFTFGLAASRFDARRDALQEEVNAIGTTYLRATFLPDEHGQNVRKLLSEYVDNRLEILQPNAPLGELIREAEQLHVELWNEASLAGQKKDTEIVALFIDALNQVIDVHAKRVTAGIRARIPMTIWLVLYFLAIVAMASMGYHAGLTGTARSITGWGMMLCFSIVMLLITDLDRPRDGLLQVNQQSMYDLRESMDREM